MTVDKQRDAEETTLNSHIPDHATTLDILRQDADTLHKFGYAQELSRRMSGFGNFALSFMIIGVFGSACINMQQGISTAGMFGISVMWLAGCFIAYATAASLGEISSAIPTAGGLYHWSSVLGGRGWGWATAWINLLAYVFSVAGAAVVMYLVFKQMFLGWVLGIDTSQWGYWQQALSVAVILIVQATLNHCGVRLLARLSEIGAYLTLAGVAMLFVVLALNFHAANVEHMFHFTNNSGPLGGDVVPRTTNLVLIYGYALLLPMWIITTYDASAHASEETVNAARAVPRAMVNSVLLSAVVGFVLLTALGLAMKDQTGIARQGDNAFAALFDEISAPKRIKDFISISMIVAQFICGTCCLTGFSRAVFAFSRDHGLPESLRKISSSFRTPAVAIWACAIVAFLATLYSSALAALAAGTALFYQLCYGMAILAAMFSRHREYGPYRLGLWSKPLSVIGVVGGVFLIWVGLQPPTSDLVGYFVALFVALIVGWFGLERRRFPGPPASDLMVGDRALRIHERETALGEITAAPE